MDYENNVVAYEMIEQLLQNAHSWSTLPISRERAQGICQCTIPASREDLLLLRRELATPVVEN